VKQVTRPAEVADSAAGAILEASARIGAELIVVGTRELTGLRELAIGSVAHKATSAASCPVLIIR
jgi:nucleotide-binding universal stress UspA family protein